MIDELKFIGCLTSIVDTSNHKKIKVFKRRNIKYFIRLHNECFKKYNLLKNVAFSGDSCNTNFGGVLRKGTNNVFAILNEKLKRNISDIVCAAHILHNAMRLYTVVLIFCQLRLNS